MHLCPCYGHVVLLITHCPLLPRLAKHLTHLPLSSLPPPSRSLLSSPDIVIGLRHPKKGVSDRPLFSLIVVASWSSRSLLFSLLSVSLFLFLFLCLGLYVTEFVQRQLGCLYWFLPFRFARFIRIMYLACAVLTTWPLFITSSPLLFLFVLLMRIGEG